MIAEIPVQNNTGTNKLAENSYKETTTKQNKILDIESEANNTAEQIKENTITDNNYIITSSTSHKHFENNNFSEATISRLPVEKKDLEVKVETNIIKEYNETTMLNSTLKKDSIYTTNKPENSSNTNTPKIINDSTLIEYNKNIKTADYELSKRNYALAKFYYNRALSIVSNCEYSINQIKKIGEFTNFEITEEQRNKYNTFIKNAKKAYNNKDYSVARSYYQQAISINPNDSASVAIIVQIEEQIYHDQIQQKALAYKSYIEKADAALNNKEYAVARSYYNRALNERPQDKYATDKLEKIQKILEN